MQAACAGAGSVELSDGDKDLMEDLVDLGLPKKSGSTYLITGKFWIEVYRMLPVVIYLARREKLAQLSLWKSWRRIAMFTINHGSPPYSVQIKEVQPPAEVHKTLLHGEVR